MSKAKIFITACFNAVVESLNYDQQLIEKYFSKDYLQIVDGKEIDFDGFCQHMRTQKTALQSISVTFNTIAQEDDVIFTNHIVELQTKEGRPAKIQVIAEFHIKDSKICYCNELTRQISGDKREHDLGSR